MSSSNTVKNDVEDTDRVDKTPSAKQLNFRSRKKNQGLERAKAFFELMKAHNLNLPELDKYVNAKDENGDPLHPDVDLVVLPNPKKTITRSRIHQILMRLPEYKSQSSWKKTRESVPHENPQEPE